MPAAMTALANLTISGSSTTSVTFSSINGAYRDLYFVVEGFAASDVSLLVRFNGDTTSNYTYAGLGTSGTSTPSGFSGTQGGVFFNNWANIGTTPGLFRIHVFDYAQTNKHKSTIAQAGRSGRPGIDMMGHRWGNTAAISQVSFSILSGNFVAGTTFSLYGVSA